MNNPKTIQAQETWQRILTIPPGWESGIFDSWVYMYDLVTGKSIFLPFTEAVFTFKFDASEPVGLKDAFFFKAPTIFQFKNTKKDFPFLSCHDNTGPGHVRLAIELLRWYINQSPSPVLPPAD